LSAFPSFHLAGDLDARDVARLYQQTRSACRDGDLPQRLDLSEVGQTDSSVLALLLEWQADAKAHESSIRFDSPPESLRVLAGLSQVSELLGWEIDSDTFDEGAGA